MINIQEVRSNTPAVSQKIHFNNAGASLMPTTVVEAIVGHIHLESDEGGYEAAEQQKDALEGFYSSIASLIGSEAHNIAFTSSATNAYARALSCIPFKAGDAIVIANEDYISNQFAFLSLSKRFGTKLIRARSLETGGVDSRHMMDLIAQHQPKLVSLSHVPSNTGLVQPVEEIGNFCKSKGIMFLVDACQSAGQLPVNVHDIPCDFLCATMRKFLRGPRGAGFLYVSDKILNSELEPLFIDLRGASWIDTDQYEVRRDAKRFEDWEMPHALVLGSKAAVDYAIKIGVSSIEKRNSQLCELVRRGIDGLGKMKLLDKGDHLSSIITVEIHGIEPNTLLHQLRAKNINTSIGYKNFALPDFEAKQVDWALRISPHYYNTEEEVDKLIKSLDEIVNG